MKNEEQQKIFTENLNYYVNLSGKKQVDICADLGLKFSTFNTWMRGQAIPKVSTIKILASYFGIRLADMAYENDHSINDKIGELSKEEKEVILKLRQADEKTKAIVYFALNITEG